MHGRVKVTCLRPFISELKSVGVTTRKGLEESLCLQLSVFDGVVFFCHTDCVIVPIELRHCKSLVCWLYKISTLIPFPDSGPIKTEKRNENNSSLSYPRRQFVLLACVSVLRDRQTETEKGSTTFPTLFNCPRTPARVCVCFREPILQLTRTLNPCITISAHRHGIRFIVLQLVLVLVLFPSVTTVATIIDLLDLLTTVRSSPSRWRHRSPPTHSSTVDDILVCTLVVIIHVIIYTWSITLRYAVCNDDDRRGHW